VSGFSRTHSGDSQIVPFVDRATERVEIRSEGAPAEQGEHRNQDCPSESKRDCDLVSDAHSMFNGR